MVTQIVQTTNYVNEHCDHWSHRVPFTVEAIGNQHFHQPQHIQHEFILSDIFRVQILCTEKQIGNGQVSYAMSYCEQSHHFRQDSQVIQSANLEPS